MLKPSCVHQRLCIHYIFIQLQWKTEQITTKLIIECMFDNPSLFTIVNGDMARVKKIKWAIGFSADTLRALINSFLCESL